MTGTVHVHVQDNHPYPDHFSHIALRACVLRGILDLYQDDEEQVVPHVVLNFDVLFKGDRLIVKLVSLQTWKKKKKKRKGATPHKEARTRPHHK